MKFIKATPNGYWGNLTVKGACLLVGICITGLIMKGASEDFHVDVKDFVRPVPVKVISAAQAVAPVNQITANNVLDAPAYAAVLPLLGDSPSAKQPITGTGAGDGKARVAKKAITPAKRPPVAKSEAVPQLPTETSVAEVPLAKDNTPVEISPFEIEPDKAYPEKPYGDVLVLELMLNDQGVVFDSKILIPSYNALGDISITVAVIGKQYSNLTPPLYPGETRRLELRVPYAPEGLSTDVPKPDFLP